MDSYSAELFKQRVCKVLETNKLIFLKKLFDQTSMAAALIQTRGQGVAILVAGASKKVIAWQSK